MNKVRIDVATLLGATLACLALAIQLGLLATGHRREWTDIALPLLILGNILVMRYARLTGEPRSTRIYFRLAPVMALAILAALVWRTFHPR